ncbi:MULTISPECIES: TetM/TetW/TetO/TetS family tetracycline resistance ribosomal protection protein [Clostridium]|uniref:TetM/TetW/TetO/TetS family tetracycline resistance ribosomal protection protein n=1 Tax=Clostridium cibarium TaxID=2762247 RepID=A0ABR8PW69_9CLOT|nr:MULTISPECIES: TetM/TetW/TetO/TetS family tetracycline resistance ribosomal protection protein [Clostridium]MBD7912431.1 TetM/TetW/TetO/TetS family tetracycline resistance ribosomal protection protein [Clostridium cibarium]
MKKTIGILAHVDAGKTTFSEEILYHTNSIRSLGRVDHKNSFLDSNSIERERGITIFSEQATFKLGSSTYYLVDTPGHVDFSSEMERAIAIMDYAIVIVSGVEGIEGHTETVWNLLRKYNIPTFFFINKMDRVGYDRDRVLDEIKRNFTKDVCFLEGDFLENENVVEFLCEKDEKFLEKYLEGSIEKDELLELFKKLIKDEKAFPCFEGSALQDIGISEFLEALESLTITKYSEEGNFKGRVYKIRYDEKGNRITFIKSLGGRLKVRDEFTFEGNTNKVTSIKIFNGNKGVIQESISAGDVFAVTGLTEVSAGQGIGDINEDITYEMVPTLTSKVIYDKALNVKDVLAVFKILDEEDPALNVIWNEKLQEIHINIMGKIQLEVLKEVLKDRFSLNIEFGPCKILYKETITTTVIGSGHFEPLRHYAEVHLKLEPGKRNTGIHFQNKCKADDLNIGHQNLIKTHIFEREHHGILTGSSLTDVKITLLTGRAHLKHTSGGDFREATFRALRQGLEKANNILLEPYYKFKIVVKDEHIGRVLSDIQKYKGSFEPYEINEGIVTIMGRGPVKTFMDYSSEIVAFTKGKGTINLVFDGYDVCHDESEVIEEFNYDKNSDIEYTSTSIFCSKGEGYLVKWDMADEKMHCEIIT